MRDDVGLVRGKPKRVLKGSRTLPTEVTDDDVTADETTSDLS
jgi:hypothetical protein